MVYKITGMESLAEEVDYIFKVMKTRFPGFNKMFEPAETSRWEIKRKYIKDENFKLRKIYSNLKEIVYEKEGKHQIAAIRENTAAMAFYIWITDHDTIRDLFDDIMESNYIIYVDDGLDKFNYTDRLVYKTLKLIRYNSISYCVYKDEIDIPTEFDCVTFIDENFIKWHGEVYARLLKKYYNIYKDSVYDWFPLLEKADSDQKRRFFDDVKNKAYELYGISNIWDYDVSEMIKKDWDTNVSHSNIIDYGELVNSIAHQAEDVMFPKKPDSVKYHRKSYPESKKITKEQKEWEERLPFLGGASGCYMKTENGFCIRLLFDAFCDIRDVEAYVNSHDVRKLCKYAINDSGNLKLKEVREALSLVDTAEITDVFTNDRNYTEVYFKTKDNKKELTQDEIDAKNADKYARSHKRGEKIDDIDKIYSDLVEMGEDLYN